MGKFTSIYFALFCISKLILAKEDQELDGEEMEFPFPGEIKKALKFDGSGIG